MPIQRKKIEQLTPEQHQAMLDYRDEWLAIGRSTEPADRETAERVFAAMYKELGREAPYVWWCDGPAVAACIRAIVANPDKHLRANLGDNLRDNLWANLWTNLWTNLGDNLRANLRANLWTNLRANLWTNLRANLGTNLRANLGDNLRDNLWANLRANLRANLGDNLRANLGDNLRDNLWANLRANLGDNLRDNLWANLWTNLGDNLRANLRDNLRDNLWANLRANLGDNLRDNLGFWFWGAHESAWPAFYNWPDAALRKIYSKEDRLRLSYWLDLCRSMGWWEPYEGVVFACERPSLYRFDDRGLLHCEDGPAIVCRDGWEVHCWHGINIPSRWITDKPTASEALTWDNMEQRRAACEIVGWVNILEELNAETIDKHDNPMVGELIAVDIPDVGRERFLRVKCGTNRLFALPVPPDMDTAENAQRWLNFIPDDTPFLPEIRT